MNFTEQEAYDGIIGRLKEVEANPLFNERGIKAMIKRDLTMLKDVEIELDAYVAEAVVFAKDVDGNIRKVNTETVDAAKNQAVEDYKAANPPQTQQQSANGTDGELSPELKAFEDRLKLLEDENSNLKNQNILKDKKADVFAKFKEKGIDDKDWLNETMELAPLSTDTDIDAYVKKGVKLYNRSKSATPTGSATGGSGSSSDKSDDFFSALAELGNLQSNKQVKVI